MIPVGPGHEVVAEQARASVEAADLPVGWAASQVVIQSDQRGELGRSRARNAGLLSAQQRGANDDDWVVWLDADDLLEPAALLALHAALAAEPWLDALWGPHLTEWAIRDSAGAVIERRDAVAPTDSGPLRRHSDLTGHGPFGALHVGFFQRFGNAALMRWRDDWMLGEDIDYCWRVAGSQIWRKGDRPLVRVRTDVASASGPAGYGALPAGDVRWRAEWLRRARVIAALFELRGPVGSEVWWTWWSRVDATLRRDPAHTLHPWEAAQKGGS